MVFLPSLVSQAAPTPESPEEKITETPRLPSWAMRLHTERAYFSGTLCRKRISQRIIRNIANIGHTCSSSPYEVEITLGKSESFILTTF